MRKRFPLAAAAALAAAVALPLAAVRGSGGGPLRPRAAVAQAAATVPKAECGPNDRVETGLQGQTTLAERFSGASMQAYTCNLELVGQFEGEGASWQFASFDYCGYFGTANQPTQQHRGTVVVDASDPANPVATGYLTDAAFLDPWESLKVNQKRKLLGATKGPGIDRFGPAVDDRYFAFYDIKDCARPKLLAELEVPGHIGHAGDFAPDGLTYYGTSLNNNISYPGHLTAIDIVDPKNPRVLTISRDFLFHDIALSDDGTRLYGSDFGILGAHPNGLTILDVSDIQNRRPDPQIRVISRLHWPDGRAAQVPTPVRIKGKPYIIFADEGAYRASGCAQGMSPFGYARLIDISDETRPTIVSKLMLEVHDPANCSRVLNDFHGLAGFQYDSHYCSVDNPNNTRLVACGYFQAGVRVFDIRDPRNPKEIAYYKPPARRTAFKPGSWLYGLNPTGDRTADWAGSNFRFVHAKNGDLQLWFTSQDNGFQIVRFTNGLLARTGLDRFEQDHPGNRN